MKLNKNLCRQNYDSDDFHLYQIEYLIAMHYINETHFEKTFENII